MEHLASYPSVMQLGHKMIADIFAGPVVVEEKIDGSQFSFGVINGELVCRSKGKQQILDAPDDMFVKAIETVKMLNTLFLRPGWIYRCEYLQKPQHNTLPYSRVPAHNLILFDIDTGTEAYMPAADKALEASLLDLEVVPTLFEGVITDMAMFKSLLQTESVLGGCLIEGVVVKNYNVFTAEKKVAMGKYVSEAFKETHAGSWKDRNPTQGDIATRLVDAYRNPMRWQKAVQHLRDNGLLSHTPQDIGLLMKEVPDDIRHECEEAIKQTLFNHFWKDISRGVTRGLPEWYKEELARSAFPEGS